MAALRRGILLPTSIARSYISCRVLPPARITCYDRRHRALSLTTALAEKRNVAAPPPDMEAFLGDPIAIPADERELGQLVYVGSISNQITRTKYISFVSSLMGIALQPELFARMDQFPAFAKVMIGTFCGFFVFVTPVLIHMLARQYILRLYYDPDTEKFNAVTMKFLPTKKFTTFSPEEVEVPAVPGMFTSFTVRQPDGKKPAFFINPPEFRSQNAYIKLMGYDKPMDVINGPRFGNKENT